MDRDKIFEQISVIAARLADLSGRHGAAMIAGDIRRINQLQDEIAKLVELKDRLMTSLASRPPGTTGRSVR